MIPDDPLPLKNIGLRVLLFCGGLISVYLTFIGIVSLWVGLHHLEQDGCWMPILTGTLIIAIVLSLFIRLLLFVLNQTREKGIFDL